MSNDTADKITLHVGDHTFNTTKNTLSLKNGFLRTLSETNQHEFFIDRDGKHFRIILNYLRGSSVLPTNTIDLQELLFESDFYCLHDLTESIKQRLNIRTPTIETTLLKIAEQLKYIR